MSRDEILESFIFTDPFMQRCLERGIDVDDINFALKFGKPRFCKDSCCKFRSAKVCIVVNMERKTYVTAWRK